ncbi:Major Facilitator Superfamily protein [Micromonospora purpureochromogenes]|uniref:Major Facilitator Superfamily protein n=1 Tax=Micromonospora purpureochromogenes TaxID=47872 RepID=A0A1C4UQ05_9ACTN|nr:MFS transporter [Micromonospora purpureochromogenes]SCE73735.1 Major Facilitator Superfamily protein [Micromonospora purpureochromogenes]
MITTPLGRDYRLLWSAAVSSRFGDALRTPALALLTATLTRDPRAVAVVAVAAHLPPLLLGLLGGVYADRWDRRRTMALVDALRAAVVAALAATVAVDRAGVPALVATAFLLAALGVLFDAASFALLPALVPAPALPAANGRLQAGTALAGGLLGAPLAGVLFAVSPSVPLTVDAATFALAALLTLALSRSAAGPGRGARPGSDRSAPGPGRRGTAAGPDGRAGRRGRGSAERSVWREAADGVRWLRGEPTMWRITLLSAGTNLAISALLAVLVLYALDVLRVPPAGYGLFMAAVVLGGLAGALGAGRLAARLGTTPALRAVLLTQTVALAGFALVRHPVPAALALAVFAGGSTVWNSLWAAYGQGRVPAALLGRVGATQRMAALLTAPVGATLAGLAGAAYGVGPVVGAAAVVFALVTLAAWRALRPVAPAPDDAPPTTAGTAARPGPLRSR